MIPMETTSGYLAVERILLPEDAVCLQHHLIMNYICTLAYHSMEPILLYLIRIIVFFFIEKTMKLPMPSPPKKIL